MAGWLSSWVAGWLSFCLCLSIRLPVCLTVCLSVCSSAREPVYLISVRLYTLTWHNVFKCGVLHIKNIWVNWWYYRKRPWELCMAFHLELIQNNGFGYLISWKLAISINTTLLFLCTGWIFLSCLTFCDVCTWLWNPLLRNYAAKQFHIPVCN